MKKGPDIFPVPESRDMRDQFHKLFVAYRNAVFKTAYAILRNREEAMDIVQDTFLKAMEKENSLRKSPSVKGWLLKVARNLSIDRYRRLKSVPLEPVLAVAAAGAGHDSVLSMDLKDVIREVFPQLPQREQAVFALKYYEDMTLREIAAAIGVTEGTVKTLHHRVITRIRKKVADKWGGK